MSTPVSPSEATKAFTKTKATVPKKHVVVEVKVKDSGDATKPKETCASPQKSQAGVSKAEVSTKTLSMPKPQTRVVFMRDLEAFLKSKGMLWDKYPTFVNAELDLYKVYNIVAKWGGSESVTEHKKWKAVAESLKLNHLPTSASHSLKNNYMRYLRDYEMHRRNAPPKKRGRPPKVRGLGLPPGNTPLSAVSSPTTNTSYSSAKPRVEPTDKKRKAEEENMSSNHGNGSTPKKKKGGAERKREIDAANAASAARNGDASKRPIGRPRKEEAGGGAPFGDLPKRPIGRPRKDGQASNGDPSKRHTNHPSTAAPAAAAATTRGAASNAPTVGWPGPGHKAPKVAKVFDDMSTAELHIQSALDQPPVAGDLASMVHWLKQLGRAPTLPAALEGADRHAVRSLLVRQAMSQGRNSSRATAEIIVRLLGRHPDEEDNSEEEDSDFAGEGRGPLRGRKKGSRVGSEFQAQILWEKALNSAAMNETDKFVEAVMVGRLVRSADDDDCDHTEDAMEVDGAVAVKMGTAARAVDLEELQLEPEVAVWTGRVGLAEATDWTDDERRGFCQGMYAVGNDLLTIQKQHVPSKPIRRVVGYYYNVWRADLIEDVARWKEHVEAERVEEERLEQAEEDERLAKSRAEHALTVARKELRQSFHWAKNVSRCAGSKENLLAHLDTHAERLRPLWEAAMRRVAPAGQLVPPSLRPVELKAADSHECLAPLGGGEPLPKKKRGRPPKVKPAEKAFLAGAAAVAEAAPVFAEKEKAAAAVVESAEKAAAEGAGAVEEAPHCAEAAEPGEKGAQAEDVENATLVD